MFIEYKEDYQNLILKKAAFDKIEIQVISEDDIKLQEMLFDGELPKIAKSKKKVGLHTVATVIFGQSNLTKFMNSGWESTKDIVKYKKPTKAKKKKSTEVDN